MNAIFVACGVIPGTKTRFRLRSDRELLQYCNKVYWPSDDDWLEGWFCRAGGLSEAECWSLAVALERELDSGRTPTNLRSSAEKFSEFLWLCGGFSIGFAFIAFSRIDPGVLARPILAS